MNIKQGVKPKKHVVQRLTLDHPLVQTALAAVQDKKANHIITLDLREIEEAVADFFIICDVQTSIQMNTVAEHLEKEIREKIGERPFHFELSPAWTLVDYVNLVVHIFNTEERKFYDLEGLWLDAKIQEH